MAQASTVQSLTRGLRILEMLAQSGEGLPLHAIAGGNGLKRPATHKLLRTLVESGFVERASAPIRYRLGPAAMGLATARWGQDILQRASEEVQALAMALPVATVTLAQFIGSEVTIVLRMSQGRPAFLERPVSHHLAPYGSASGLLFQAYWSEEERGAFRSKYPFAEYSSGVWSSVEALDAFLFQVRKSGFCCPPLHKTAICMAAPVFDAGGTIHAALGMSGAEEEINSAGAAECRRLLTDAARRLSDGARAQLRRDA